ncbi:TetR/AcrR family transcriptional regulator [Romboutsia sp.]|uniref:TetR/AcrR family transcriptional regulator n=1 Tax=Romboutsia sp. TaxID=1965302 RepID=UPI003F2E4090
MESLSNYLIKGIDKEKKLTLKHQKILIAAIELISEKGYDKVATSEIAQRAGVAEGTIFRYYKTKKDLLNAIIVPSYIKFVAPMCINDFMEEVLEKDYHSFRALICHIVDDRIEFAKREELTIKILIQEFISQKDTREEIKEIFIDNAYPRVNKIIYRLKEKGEIIDIYTGEVIRIIISNIFGYFIQRFIICPELNYDDKHDKEVIANTIIKALAKEK